MLLLELLQKDVNIEFKNYGSDQFYSIATIGNRRIVFTGEMDEVDGKPWWLVSFKEVKSDGKYSFSATGSGNELEVFSMVRQSMMRLIKDKDPEVILFSADKADRSRADIYERMVKRYFTGYNVERYQKNSTEIGFRMTKK